MVNHSGDPNPNPDLDPDLDPNPDPDPNPNPNPRCASTYLVAFGLGTMLAMSLFTALVGEASVQMGERLNTPDVPAKMAFASSVFAIVIGSVWTIRASLALGLPAAVLSFLRMVALRFSRSLVRVAVA